MLRQKKIIKNIRRTAFDSSLLIIRFESKSYKKTRLFYQSVGFKPLEVFPMHWDKDNPCLFMAKSLAKRNNKVNKLIDSNMDIDFSNADFGNSQCPWNGRKVDGYDI